MRYMFDVTGCDNKNLATVAETIRNVPGVESCGGAKSARDGHVILFVVSEAKEEALVDQINRATQALGVVVFPFVPVAGTDNG